MRTVLITLALALALVAFAPKPAAHASTACTYQVQRGDWLSRIAARDGLSWQRLAALNHLANPNLIYPGERLTLCAPRAVSGGPSWPHAVYHAAHYVNYGAPGECVWYAQARRPDLNLAGVKGAQDLARVAPQRGYAIGQVPAVGALAVFAPRVDGANATYGHVGYVSAVYSDGSFQVAAMAAPWRWTVSYAHLHPTAGITFIYG